MYSLSELLVSYLFLLLVILVIGLRSLISQSCHRPTYHYNVLLRIERVNETILLPCSKLCSSDVVYLDFKKAFDRVAHNELLLKLWSYGITGNIENDGSDHTSLIGFDQQYCIQSLPFFLSGVPQGSIIIRTPFVFYLC